VSKNVRRRPVAAANGTARRRAGRRAAIAIGGAAVVLFVAAAYLSLRTPRGDAPENSPTASRAYVGVVVCAGCHGGEAARWRGSHHALAMQEAGDRTVLGDFGDASITYYGVTSRFFRRDGRFFVNTDGPDGEMADFPIAYTFGVFPLQQYLVGFPDGRFQALPFAWDARPKEEGGQHWFHLYPDQSIQHDDALHWTGLNQNWNFMCAECHSTDLHKNYDAATNRFHSSWAEIDVSCEACHGPGSRHVAWAQRQSSWWSPGGADDPDKGLPVTFAERAGVTWRSDEASGEVRRSRLPAERTEVETCGRCHARRAELAEGWLPGRPLADTHLVALLERGLYHADGTIEDEVYEYGSFRQSRMFANGVTCSDCHDPHSASLRASGDALCQQCHAAPIYAASEHSHHGGTSPPVACISCHMPARTYMGIDRRHDHGLRVPRPDLSATLGTPNACADCHKDRPAEWAAAAIERWYGPKREGFQNFAAALAAARRELPQAPELLDHVVSDPETSAIARATALAQMAPYLTPGRAALLRRGIADPDPLVRLGALRGLEAVGPERRWSLAAGLLDDPAGAVRIEATAFLAEVPANRLSPEDRQHFARAAEEYIAVQRFNADRPEAHVTLGAFFARRGQAAAAEAEYRAAMRLAPRAVAPYVNLADLDRALGHDREGEVTLRQALAIAPEDAAAQHALGLLLVREHRLSEAMPLLEKAASLDPQRARYAYVYAIALSTAGRRDDALRVLGESHERHPADRETLAALTSLEREAGRHADALGHAEALARLAPGDPAVKTLIDALQRE
jgi:predicted CXXCH cytochrome family protein